MNVPAIKYGQEITDAFQQLNDIVQNTLEKPKLPAGEQRVMQPDIKKTFKGIISQTCAPRSEGATVYKHYKCTNDQPEKQNTTTQAPTYADKMAKKSLI